MNGEYLVSTATESYARVSAILPTRPSEDVRKLLQRPPLPARSARDYERDEYLPSEAIEWVVDVDLSAIGAVGLAIVKCLFIDGWEKGLGNFNVFGRDAGSRKWTYAFAAGGPSSADGLKLAWDYVNPLYPDTKLATHKVYRERLLQVRSRLERLGDVRVTTGVSPEDAEDRAKYLKRLIGSIYETSCLILKAPPGKRFDGKHMWDVMLCLGLHWGDMDLFHWENESAVGDDHLFSVETSTNPGYFFPEEIAAGRVQVEDLVFTFSIPRSPAPTLVFDAMSNAVTYCQKRLGGSIQTGDGRPAGLAMERSKIESTVGLLHSAGFLPGADEAMTIF